jgi:hypothetical protein
MPSAHADNNLKQFQWQNRLLLIFTPERRNTDFQKMMRASQKHQEGFVERDLLRISVIRGDESVTVHGAPAPEAGYAGLPAPEQLYDRYNIDESRFAALLIGKDGEVKARWSHPVAINKIFAEIDAMPMRRREIEKRDNEDNWL